MHRVEVLKKISVFKVWKHLVLTSDMRERAVNDEYRNADLGIRRYGFRVWYSCQVENGGYLVCTKQTSSPRRHSEEVDW